MEPLEKSSIDSHHRRSRKVKNLQEEVDLILSQDESGDIPERKLPQTPSTSAAGQLQLGNEGTPSASEMSVLKDAMQTPRRSCRKSIKPPRDYDEIVTRSLRSVGKSAKKSLRSFDEEENEENMESLLVEEEDDINHQKWSVSIVGSYSTKRGRKRGRKSKKEKEEEENRHLINETVHDSKMTSEEGIFSDKTEDKSSERINENRIIPEIIIHSPQEECKNVKALETNNSVVIMERNPKELETVCAETNEKIPEEKSNDVQEICDNAGEEKPILEDETPIEDHNNLNDKKIDENLNDFKKEEFFDSKDNIQKNVGEFKKEEDIEVQKDKFGSFLKSKNINATDLGLIPLKDEDDTEEVEGDIKSMEDMPSLIVLDDDEEEHEISKPKLNVTFETNTDTNRGETDNDQGKRTSFESKEGCNDSLQIFLQNEAATKFEVEETVDMCSLQISDDEGTPSKVPRIVINETATNNKLLSTPKTMGNPSTPKQKNKPYRFPTPHSNKFQSKEPSSYKPKDIVLRGIRKRSLSMSVVGFGNTKDSNVTNTSKQQQRMKGPLATHRQQKAVNFYSPANQTTIIDDLDKKIADSVRKDKNNKPNLETSYVTTRRKRSLSLDESMISKSLTSKIPRLEVKPSTFVPTASSSNSKVSRTKMPNFAAIHQKHFQQMENLVDHVQRKQERSKILINSATKIKQVSAQKNISVNKNIKSNGPEKPKALKKIDLDMKSKVTNFSMAATENFSLTKENETTTIKESKLPHPRDLPNPKMIKIMNKHQKHLFEKQHLKPTQTINVLANTTKVTATTAVQKSQQSQKPFNLSTQITTVGRPVIVKPILTKSSNTQSTSAAASWIVNASKPILSSQDKMASRLQRHMDLFKGRNPATRSGVAARKMEANIKGVRSNRRFELQMKHRKNLEN